MPFGPFGVYFSCADPHTQSPTSSAILDPSASLHQLLLRCKQSPSAHTALSVREEQVFAGSIWQTKLLIPNPCPKRALCRAWLSCQELGLYHTRAWEGGKKSNQTARGELLFLLGAGSPLSHCLSPQRSRPLEREAGIVSALGTDAVTKSTFLSSRHQLPFTCCWTRFVCCGVRPSLSQMHQENHSAWETPSSHSRAPDTQKSTEK